MTERHSAGALILVVAVVLALGVAAGPVTANSNAPTPPVHVNQTFVGTSADADHAVEVTVTVAPTERSGPINNTVLTLDAERAAFIAPSSITTSETTGGDQVITRSADRPPTFDIDRMDPGETASISFRVYPKAVLPSGETLATVDVETQFVRTQRVVTTETPVAPTVSPDQAAYANTPGLPPIVSGALGAGGAAIVACGVGLVYRRRLRSSARDTLRSVANQPLPTSAERTVTDAIESLGGTTQDDPTTSDAPSIGTTRDTESDDAAFDFED
ncbi:hypothetical protein [Halarchaeum sp. P4]|uniref:hypothetical protein n=1 Tax=Halarchaeum sp. P4 TaxID=3421639 RepID=UPI003EBCDC28